MNFWLILDTVENPVLIHYGSYETKVPREVMAERYGKASGWTPNQPRPSNQQ